MKPIMKTALTERVALAGWGDTLSSDKILQ
jgi:hypothetical protein